MPFEDRVKYMEQGTGQVFYLWQDEDENDWALGMFDGAQGGVEIIRRFDSKSNAEEFLAELRCGPVGATG
jgi:hypothetical protein